MTTAVNDSLLSFDTVMHRISYSSFSSLRELS